MAKKRSRYETYLDWYDKYSKNSEMETSKMSESAFNKMMAAYKEADIVNPARRAAASQRIVNQKQAKGFSETAQMFTEEQIATLKAAGFSVPNKFSQKWIKQNASVYYQMLKTLGISWAEAVSPKEVKAA